MDSFDMVTLALIGVILILAVTFFYYLGLLIYRSHHSGYKVIWRWRVYDFTNQVNTIIANGSEYINKRAPKKDIFMSYYSTVDDDAMVDMYLMFKDRLNTNNEMKMMKFILRFVQLNVDYVKDINQYGKSEHYVLPINTLIRRKGDCEDSSFLFQSITYPLGLETKCIRIQGHITTGISKRCFIPFTTTYNIRGIAYKQAETTNVVPFGCNFGQHEVLYSATPMVPNDDFKRSLISDVVE